MTGVLYFIPMLTTAWQKAKRDDALRNCFQQLRAYGKTPHGAAGYAQFLRFMQEVNQAHERSGSPDLRLARLILARVFGTSKVEPTTEQWLRDVADARAEWARRRSAGPTRHPSRTSASGRMP